jgi:hypothetical protein
LGNKKSVCCCVFHLVVSVLFPMMNTIQRIAYMREIIVYIQTFLVASF